MGSKRILTIDPANRTTLLHSHTPVLPTQAALPIRGTRTHPRGSDGKENASIYFIGNATTIIEWQDVRILTDPNFLHAGDHVHLGPGVTAKRLKDPAVDLHELPPLDCILLSHYHEDHFDRKVEESLNKGFPIVTTPHAKDCLTTSKAEAKQFQNIWSVDHFEELLLDIKKNQLNEGGHKEREPKIKVTGMPGKHVPPGPLAVANDILKAVPPTNGWLLELGYSSGPDGSSKAIKTGYRIYISGDTLFVDDLKEIPKRLQNDKIDLMLVHLGGTTIPGPNMPLLMVTMDATQGLQLMQLMDPDVTIPIHFDDYDVMLSPLSDFKKEVDGAGLRDRVVYLERGERYGFMVRDESDA